MTATPSHADFRLEAQGLAIARGGRTLADGLNFTLANGGAVALTGPNGAGKSTLLRVLAGLSPKAGGALFYNDQPVAGDEADILKQRLAYFGHRTALKPMLSVADNLSFWAALRNRPAGAVADALDALGIAALASLPVRLLSEGQARRVALARVMASGACLWLLDEPNTALDEDARQRVARLINDHLAAGGAVIAATHSPLHVFGATIIRLGAPPKSK